MLRSERIPLSTIESMPGERYVISKEKDRWTRRLRSNYFSKLDRRVRMGFYAAISVRIEPSSLQAQAETASSIRIRCELDVFDSKQNCPNILMKASTRLAAPYTLNQSHRKHVWKSFTRGCHYEQNVYWLHFWQLQLELPSNCEKSYEKSSSDCWRYSWTKCAKPS